MTPTGRCETRVEGSVLAQHNSLNWSTERMKWRLEIDEALMSGRYM